MSVRLDDRNPMTTADVLVTVAGLAGYFSTFSGINVSFSRPTYSDGLSAVVRSAASGTKTIADVSISRSFDPLNADDEALLQWITTYEGGAPFDTQVRPIKRDNGVEFRGNKSWSLAGCRIKAWETVSGLDTGSGSDVVKIMLTFTVETAVWS